MRGADGGGGGHGGAARCNQAQPVGKGQSPSVHQGGILAQGQASHGGGGCGGGGAIRGGEELDGGEAGDEQSGLRDSSVVEAGLWPPRAHGAQIIPSTDAASSSMARTVGRAATAPVSMPTAWAPWPGKRNAVWGWGVAPPEASAIEGGFVVVGGAAMTTAPDDDDASAVRDSAPTPLAAAAACLAVRRARRAARSAARFFASGYGGTKSVLHPFTTPSP